jgi:hypothetical protein
MRRKAAIVLASAIVCGVAIGAGLFLQDDEPWPPDWYVSPATNGAEHAALRRRAIATPTTESPPNEATLAFLRNLAVVSALDTHGSRLDEARVYEGSGHVLQLRGRFSTARIRPSPPGWKPERPFEPCLTLVLDPSTLFATSASLGKCEDLAPLGESIPLDLAD